MGVPTRLALTLLCLVLALACHGRDEERSMAGTETPVQDDDVGSEGPADAMMMKKKAAMDSKAAWKRAMVEQGSEGVPDVRRCWVDGHALGGFDPVSYRRPRPLRGLRGITAEYEGATYVFATPENRDRFVADPERFVPRYAGWCAMSLALGAFVCPDYENYKIEEGELLLFETTVFTNGRTLWNQDPERHRVEADEHFGTLAAR